MQQKSLVSVLCFVILSFDVASVSAQNCIDDGSFMINGTYDANRHRILASLPSNVSAQDGFFYSGSVGQEPNRIYAIGMCIPGSDPDDCSECIKQASADLIKSCTYQTYAYTWPGEPTLCHVRYSNTSFSGNLDLGPRYLLYNTGDIEFNLTLFTAIWEDLTVRLVDAASTAKSTPLSSDNYYAASITALTTSDDIYALMQCAPDLSSSDCRNCLKQSTSDFQACCGGKQGGVVMRPSCFFRWDLYPYSKAFTNIVVAFPPPFSVPSPPGDRANTNDNEDSKGISNGIVIAITIPALVTFLILLALGFVLYRRRKTMPRNEYESDPDSDVSTTNSIRYDYKTIEAATDQFSRSNKLGEGAFGRVYKGKFPDGTVVAVKRLSDISGQDTRKFRNEVKLVSKLQHRNLVRLLGFCLQGDEKILIYEFVPNKSLDYYLFDTEKQGQLDWTQRYKIIGGTAQGILYLHQDSQLTIIYRDFKASNILLDADMNPKISDFGMATVFGMEETRGNTNWIAETFVYMPPEYAMHGKFSMKSDVYSFGILVLEIISGKKNSNFYQIDENTAVGNLVAYAWRLWRNRSQLELVDPAIQGNYDNNEVIRCIHIALLCVQENPEDRPVLSTINEMLANKTISLPMPRLPGFFPTKQA